MANRLRFLCRLVARHPLAAALAALVNLVAVALPATPIARFPNLLIGLWTVTASVLLLLRERRGKPSSQA